MNDLPIDESGKPKIPKTFLFSVLIFSVLMLTLPLGVYLVGQRTNLIPKAEVPQTSAVEASLSFEGRGEVNEQQVEVAIIAHSDNDRANLFSAKVLFPPDLIEVESIATNSAKLAKPEPESINLKQIYSSFDNDKGEANLLVGVAKGGLKTKIDSGLILGTINFKIKQEGKALLTIDESSAIYRNSDSLNILATKKTLTINVEEGALPSMTPKASIKPNPKAPSLSLISPKGGEVYTLNSKIPIQWEAANLGNITISLLVNDLLLGKIADVSASEKSFIWKPISTLPLVYINNLNSFKVKIEAEGENGERLVSQSLGPFSVYTEKNITSLDISSFDPKLGDLNSDGKINLVDISRLLSYLYREDADKKYDLNQDGVVNDLDLWFLTRSD